MVLNHYLIVKEWCPNFDPLTDKMEKKLIWVRFPCLSIEYYNKDWLMKLRKQIWRPIRMDQTTNYAYKGKFVRMCVEVDFNKPLLPKFKLKRQVVCFKGIPNN